MSSTSIQEKIAKVDFSKLKPDDPRFMLMPWPKIHGPAAQAYGRHFAWKRRLSDTERLRWEQWAIYQLSNEDHDPFQFQLEDYAKQHHWKALEENTARLISKGEKSAGEQVAKRLEELRRQETEDVLRAMKAYYEAFNKKNMEHLLSFWLPNDQSELTLPGVPKMKGLRGVEEAYRQIFHGVFPMCTIEPHILGVQTFGNVAVVFTLEVPRKGADQRDTKKATPASANAHQDRTQDPRPMQGPLPDLPMLLSKMFFPQLGSRNKQTSSSSLSPEQGGSPASKSPSRILSMTTLRHTNQMWRIWSHHTTMIDSAAFLGNAVDIAALVREKQAVEREADAAANVLPLQ
eukprot:gene14630-10461_t